MIDPVWDEKYSQGHCQRYPWDSVVSFVFKNAPQSRPKEDVKICEVGFGTGANLWFAAREGFHVSGIEGSSSAVAYAKSWFRKEGLVGDLQRGDFTRLPFENGEFDLLIDRESLVCVGKSSQKEAISEIHRVLKVGGKFFFNTYSDNHTSFHMSDIADDGLRADIKGGSLIGVGSLNFISRSEIDELFGREWKLQQVQRREWVDMLGASSDIHAEWLVIAEKRSV